MELVAVYEGQTLLAEMLVEALRERGIPSVRQATEPMLGVIGELATPPFVRVSISARDWETHRQTVEECLMFVREDEGDAPPPDGEEAA